MSKSNKLRILMIFHVKPKYFTKRLYKSEIELKKVSVQGDTTDGLGFRISDHQTKYDFDFRFPVEV